MILILSSHLTGIDPATKLLSNELFNRNLDNLVINPHNLTNTDNHLIYENGKLYLLHNEKKIIPSIVYVQNNLRCDAIIKLPNQTIYPNVFRSRIAQFIQDIRFAFEHCEWFPGRFENIERGNSKPYLMLCANNLSIKVPNFTYNSCNYEKILHNKMYKFYKKNLGPPFVISLNKESGVEIGVTITNDICSIEAMDIDGHPWQWQEYINFKSQTRSYFVDEKEWTAVLERPENFIDLRQKNEVENSILKWRHHKLPKQLANSVIALMKILGIRIASPEFLISQTGEYLLIDLNPCGDWLGFFSDESNKEIIRYLGELFQTTIKHK